MKLDLDALDRTGTFSCTADELIALVKIAKAAILTTKYRQSAPEMELLADELREAGLL